MPDSMIVLSQTEREAQILITATSLQRFLQTAPPGILRKYTLEGVINSFWTVAKNRMKDSTDQVWHKSGAVEWDEGRDGYIVHLTAEEGANAV